MILYVILFTASEASSVTVSNLFNGVTVRGSLTVIVNTGSVAKLTANVDGEICAEDEVISPTVAKDFDSVPSDW